MTKFIKLTESKGNIVIINVARIEHITMGSKGNDTYVKLIANGDGKENYFFVKESVGDAWSMLDS